MKMLQMFEALVEMWNIENQKKTIFERNRRNSNYTQNTKKQESINRAKTFNAKYIIGLEDNKKIKLDKKKHNKKNKKSKSCC